MKHLVISGETDVPSVDFNYETGVLFIGGSSLPENVLETYAPVINWLSEYMKNPNIKTDILFDFEYLNTASTNMVAKIARMLWGFLESKTELNIKWHFPADDYDIRDLGEELFEDITCSFELIEKKDK